MFRNLSSIAVENIPRKVNKDNILRRLEYFLLNHGIAEKIISVKYLGGCSNHALKVTVETEQKAQNNMLVRLPGSQAELLINRRAERVNTAIVAALGICPSFANRFTVAGNILQEQGFKAEAFLENAQSLTHETFPNYRKQALAQLKRVHQCGMVFESQYNLLERIKLMCYSLQDVDGHEISSFTYHNGHKEESLKQIILQIERMEALIKGFGTIQLVPCHNDLPPFNFMIIPNQNGESEIKIIDWEYAAMNDGMCELAYIANENGYHTRAAITELLNEYYAGDEITEDELQQNIDRVLFYLPIIDLKVAIWSLLQANMCNQSQYIDELRKEWIPNRYQKYLEKIKMPEYKAVISRLELQLNQSVTHQSVFRAKHK